MKEKEFDPILFYIDVLVQEGPLTIERSEHGSTYIFKMGESTYNCYGQLTEEKLMEAVVYLKAVNMYKRSMAWPR